MHRSFAFTSHDRNHTNPPQVCTVPSNVAEMRSAAWCSPSAPITGAEIEKRRELMRKKIAAVAAAIGLASSIGVTLLSADAEARTRTCYKCTGGWCCY